MGTRSWRGLLRVALVGGMVVPGLALVSGARADDTTTVSAPYPSDRQFASCNPGSGTCSADADADPTSGAVSANVSISAPSGGDSYAYGEGYGVVAGGFELAQAVTALDVEVTIHVDTAQAGHSGAGAAPSSHAVLFTDLDVFAPCWSCSAHAYATVLDEPDGASGSATGDYTASVRLVNPDGQLPPGHIGLYGGVQVSVQMPPGDTGTEAATVNATVTRFTASPAVLTETRTEAKPYVGVGGDVVTTGPVDPVGGSGCSGTAPGVGGSCFTVGAADQFVDLAIADDHSANPIAGEWQFMDPAGYVITSGTFCGSTGALPVPEGDHFFGPADRATRVYVFTDTGLSLFNCDQASAATTGSITATYYG